MPSAEELFTRWFAPLYPPDALADLAASRARDVNSARDPSFAHHVAHAARVFAEMAPHVFASDPRCDFTDASVHRISALLTRERRDAWLASGEPGSSDSELFNLVVHGTMYTGECARRSRDAQWTMRRPLWESRVVLRSAAGEAELAVFQWWLKSLGDEAFEAGTASLADRYRTHVEEPTLDVASWPVIAPPDRRLPRLAKVRYDALHRHLKAHLPELKDLGVDFPSPERFAELGFKWLDFLLVGGGRALVMAGLGSAGLHLLWIGREGFFKSAFFAVDTFPEPIVRLHGDALQIVFAHEKKQLSHELLWWGW